MITKFLLLGRCIGLTLSISSAALFKKFNTIKTATSDRRFFKGANENLGILLFEDLDRIALEVLTSKGTEPPVSNVVSIGSVALNFILEDVLSLVALMWFG